MRLHVEEHATIFFSAGFSLKINCENVSGTLWDGPNSGILEPADHTTFCFDQDIFIYQNMSFYVVFVLS